jgi:hypothetical protein
VLVGKIVDMVQFERRAEQVEPGQIGVASIATDAVP